MVKSTNVIFLTVDCCRFDTWMLAKLPFLSSLGAVRRAQVYGTFTLPSHMGFFVGYLPRCVEPPALKYYSRGFGHLWRLGASRRTNEETLFPLVGSTVLEGYRNLAYFTYGVGGVRWFRSPLLQSHFDLFDFFGPDDSEEVFSPRSIADFPLSHVGHIVDTLRGKTPWFLFINCSETHAPYDLGEGFDTGWEGALQRARPFWGGKRPALEKPTELDYARLRAAQVRALESVDGRLRVLIEYLPRPILLVICGDHGEAFGEADLYGHGFPSPEVLNVPLMIAEIV